MRFDGSTKKGLYDPAYEHDACGAGFVAHKKGEASHEIVEKALTVLYNLRHRGACGCEANTGDGAGILLQVPHLFLSKVCAEEGFGLPPPGHYGVGMCFLPRDPIVRRACEQRFEDVVAEEGQHILGWRRVPTRSESLGETARKSEPVVRQVFVAPGESVLRALETDPLAFERKLYVIRKRAAKQIRFSGSPGFFSYYISSLSSRTIVYKGMLMSEQLAAFYPDLTHPAIASALAVVHSRFSTNTFPSWSRAHPYRLIAHNGEINTLRGNINWMHTRESLLKSPVFSDDDLQKILPVIMADGSDSAMFDNVLEFLVMNGRSLPHALMMMIPEPWANHESMSEQKRAFYAFHACLMEPWDGPAAIVFSDGVRIGAVLDRNGLRPARYYTTTDDLVVMSSEVGVLDLPPERIVHKGRLQPGRILLVDTEEGRIVDDDEIKERIAAEQPYRVWLSENLLALSSRPPAPVVTPDHETVRARQRVFGYTFEEERLLLAPMAQVGVEATGSMGDDAPLAVLSRKPQLLYNYFKQLFAQVTNPPIDAIREEIVTATVTTTGPERNLLRAEPASCRHIQIPSPIMSNEDMAKVRALDLPGYRSATLPILFPARSGGAGLERALEKLFAAADRAIDADAQYLILSDRGVDPDQAPIPALLAVAGLHHHLIREGRRTRVGLILESGEPREVHHFALLIGYGAAAINPYLAFETLDDMIRQGLLKNLTREKAIANYSKAAMKGVVKVISKMGLSTIQSYCGAQIFEAVGLSQQVIDRYFTWTPSRMSGIDLATLAEEVRARHIAAFPERAPPPRTLDEGGDYQWRKDGELHLFQPQTVHLLQRACRENDYRAFKRYSKIIDEQSEGLCTLRGALAFRWAATPVPLAEVEPVDSIVKRFKTGAMSYGSISREAHETLAIAMNRLGGKSNTGEGGEDPERYVPMPNGDSKNSAIKQVASARFGVTSQYLVNAQELQIKMAQGAKPGEGGQLPGTKVYPWIAKVRHATPGVGLISPPPHHDIYSIEDLAQLIHDLKNANHEARISVKLVSEVGVGTVAAGVAKAKADVVLISGHDGGTGASPQTSIKHAGLPWELGLAETHQTLVLNNLRSRITVEVDGQLKTGRDVAVAALLGAEEFGFATAPLVAMGCIMMRVCHLNTCPVGVATQDPRLRAKFSGKPEHVEAFMRFIAEELREYMARLGFRSVDEMIGRADRLEVRVPENHPKAKQLDFSKILYLPEVSADVARRRIVAQDHGLDASLDRQVLLTLCAKAIEDGTPVSARLAIRNTNRVVGTITGSAITRKHGAAGLPDDTIQLHFQGSAGQSFGAFIPRGMTLTLEGDANDYLGKGLSGGRIIVYPPAGTSFVPEENIIIGNVAFYGATGGEAYIRGMAGERFCVRNSGLHAVVEAVGDHGCEYMTGGRVVVLGKTGRNFAAGMSGGVAYVLDEDGELARRCNHDMVDLLPLEGEDEELVRSMIRRHAQFTHSQRAWRIVSSWSEVVPRFVRVMPRDYARVLEAERRVREQGLTGEEAVMAAFEANTRDLHRVGGN
jgi:glutamate synthase (ferredoxin)